MRGPLIMLLITMLPLSAPAAACSFALPPMEQMIAEVASKGVMISGAIVRSVDTQNKQPEIIRADAIFIGNPDQREFVISRSERDYERLALPPGMGCGPQRFPPAGTAFARMILVPVDSTGTRNAGWQIHYFTYEDGKQLDMLFEEAKRQGRFQNRPPPMTKRWWNANDPSLPPPR